ncbi:MAG: hypothetical protein IPL62_02590 [Caulobacteraceae bacterium]|nr:hypothetical protein [Caulobacteraceae bacterium]MBK8542538.1 hypothetical protein [Caulobacteraceae bacterium]
MSLKQAAKGGIGAILIIALVAVAVAFLVPSFATILGGLIASLWVTVMGAVAGILGGLMGS